MRSLPLALTTFLSFAACAVTPDPAPVPGAATYHRAFDAAIGAAGDAGIAVEASDRDAGRIRGTKSGVEVKIHLQWRPDATVKVEFDAAGSTQTNPTLGEQWRAAYDRRMGR